MLLLSEMFEMFVLASRQRLINVNLCLRGSTLHRVGVARTLRRHVEQNFEFARLGIFGGRGFLRGCSGSSKSKSKSSRQQDYRITGKMPRARLTCARPPRFV